MAKMFDKVSESFLDAIKSITEKKLTPAEMKKREEVAKAIERDNPDMPMDKKMAIATATAKKVAEAKLDPVDHKALKGSHADRKDKDIDNDGDVDTSDEYLHNRRKAVKKAIAKKMKEEAEQLDEILPVIAAAAGRALATRAVGAGASAMTKRVAGAAGSYAGKKLADKSTSTNMAKEEAEQIDEISAGMKARYKTKARGDLEAAQSFKSDLEHEGEPKTSRVSKDVNRIIKNRKMGMKRANEEAEQIDEISADMAYRYLRGRHKRDYDISPDGKSAKSKKSMTFDQMIKKGNSTTRALRTIEKEKKGILNREEAEQIDEGLGGAYRYNQMMKRKTNEYLGMVKKHQDAGHDLQTAKNKASQEYDALEAKRRKNARPLPQTRDLMKKEEAELTPEEIAMIEAKMAGVADDALPGNEHMCATKVFHKEWKEGTPVPTMHADPDDEGLIEWYDVMFDHGIERVMTEDMEIVSEMSHGHKKRGMKKEDVEQIDELSLDTLGNYMDKASDARGHRGLPTKKIDNRYKGVALAQKKGEQQAAKMQGKLKPVKTDYERQMDDSHRHIYGEEADVPFEGPYKKTGERKDEYGNTVKNVAKHLAKKAMKKQVGEAKEPAVVKLNPKKKIEYKITDHKGRELNKDGTLKEARGRPKKAGQMDYTVHPKTKEKLMHNNPTHMKRIENLYRTGALKRPKTEAGQNIVTQLRKASTSMRGGETVNFTHGTAKHVSAAHAQKLLDKHAGMRPAEKEAFQKKIGHSHEEMKKHV